MKIHFDRKKMREDLRDLVDDTMYRRGDVYYRYGNVQWIDASAKSECIEIEAGVLGTEDYYTTLIFDAETFHFKGGECDCPYDDYCKHMAAVGFKFLEKFEAFLNQTDFIDADDSVYVAESFVGWLKNKPLPQQKESKKMYRRAKARKILRLIGRTHPRLKQHSAPSALTRAFFPPPSLKNCERRWRMRQKFSSRHRLKNRKLPKNLFLNDIIS